ncbi:MAG: hypothetical protein IKA04_03875 [Alistipes sp.]|nr:hypothetical protein [Alistipes sp.]
MTTYIPLDSSSLYIAIHQRVKCGVAMQHLCLWWDFALGAIVERSRKATAVPMVAFCHISPFA